MDFIPIMMSEHRISLHHEARALPIEERKAILLGMQETEMHSYLASLFRVMDPAYLVEVTHGARELGKDLVVFRDDPLSPDVIAIVVKRGDVRAKTAGDVDEIKKAVDGLLQAKGERVTSEIRSQVRQSQAHPAQLRAAFATLKVTKVIVVLVGEISSGVRARFEAEIGATAAVLDLLWLINAFTQHYPQVFFDAAVTDFLDRMVQALEKDSFYAESKRTLSECFVDPVVQPDQRVSVDRNSLSVRFQAKPIQFGKLMSLIERKKRVLLVGDAGSGKSKAAAKLCIDAYRRILAQSAKREDQQVLERIPLLISARELEAIRSTSELGDKVLPTEVRERFAVG